MTARPAWLPHEQCCDLVPCKNGGETVDPDLLEFFRAFSLIFIWCKNVHSRNGVFVASVSYDICGVRNKIYLVHQGGEVID